MMLESHEPYPAYVINRWWDLIDANEAGLRIFPETSDGPINLVDTFLALGPVREMIDNFSAAGWAFLRQIRREVANSGPDQRLQELMARAEAYMKDVPVGVDAAGDVIRTVSMVARFGTAREVTLDELRVELVFPRDEEAEDFFRLAAQTE